MTKLRRLRTEGRKAFIAGLVLMVVGFVATGLSLAAALAAPKPATPTINTHPTNPTTSTSATFTFSDTTSGVTFKCSRDGAAYSTCTSGITYNGLGLGSHTFAVEAFSGSTASTAASFAWTITAPVPTITTHPADPTASGSASFKYTDALAGVTFKCSRDGSSFSTCASSGVTYTGLGDGTHTFQVKAQSGSNPASDPATFTWTIDTAGPTVGISFPANLHTYGSTGWNAGCASGAGICGSAADPSGVASVRVAVLQLFSLKYWNGSSFGSTGTVLNTAIGTTSWRLPMPIPPNGTYAVFVTATDSLGNVRPLAQFLLFSTNSTPPPAPVITGHPAASTPSTSATFTFTDSQSGVTLQCKLDSGSYAPCTSPRNLTGLSATNHCFSVVAIDSLGNTSAPASYCWTITSTNVATAIATQSGTPQFTLVNSNFAPLVAKVTNSGGNPVPGVQVTFAAPASGASGSFASCAGGNPHPYSCVVTTDASGLATASTFTAGGAPGPFTVTATATGVVTPANFSLITSAKFTIDGNLSVSQLLYPGTTQSLNLKFNNPNPSPITITASPAAPAINISIATGSSSCPAATNFSSRGLITNVVIPANANGVSLSDLGINQANWPTISMIETHQDQNACRGLHLTLSFTGNAAG